MSEYIVYKYFLHYLLAMKENEQEKVGTAITPQQLPEGQ